MAVVVVRPNSVSSGATNFPPTGAATGNAACSDDTDATYIRKLNTATGTQSTIQLFGTTTVGATQRVRQVRLRARVSTPTSAGKMDFLLGSRVSGVNYFHSGLTARGLLTTQTITGAWFTSAPDGLSWDQTRIDALRAQVTEYKDATDRGYVYELYIDVDVANQPTVTVSAPTGTITSTATPDVSWTYADTDGDTQSYYQVKVFTAAQYGAVGFSAATSTATWDSGQVGSVDSGTTVGSGLLSGVHRAYVRVAKTVNGQPFWSDYAYSQFTVSVTPPSVPTLAAAWDSTSGKVTLTVQGASPAGYTSQYFEVERSDDSGVTWAQIRSGGSISPSGTYAATVTDYEAPRETTVRYRARAVGVSGENRVPSAWSSVPQVLVTNDATWWFKCITDPTLSTGSVPVTNALDTNVEEPNTIVRPLGRDRAVVVSGIIGGQDGSYKLVVTGDDWDSIEPLILHQGTLLVQDPEGRQKYVRVTERSWSETFAAGRIAREVTLAYVEVDA